MEAKHLQNFLNNPRMCHTLVSMNSKPPTPTMKHVSCHWSADTNNVESCNRNRYFINHTLV